MWCCEVRDEELEELDRHRLESCHVNVAGGSENTYGKVNILLQTHVSQGRVDNFSLVSDQAYVAQVMTDFTHESINVAVSYVMTVSDIMEYCKYVCNSESKHLWKLESQSS